ncbi:MAG: response regulator [Vicinamibacteria bacterium]|jgi:DNA-binding response OmpR family regulator|nr:response regulator [Vicinamibacteria bacterium]
MARSILVVDDDPQILQLEKTILIQNGFDVASALSGAEALQALERQAFDLILLDVMMPEQNGFDVCRQIKSQSQHKDLPVVFLTAKGGGEALAEGFESGGEMYITKPFTASKLVAVVNAMLEAARSAKREP